MARNSGLCQYSVVGHSQCKQNYPHIDCLADPAGVMHNAPVITCNMPVTNKELVMCDKHAAEWQKLHGKE